MRRAFIIAAAAAAMLFAAPDGLGAKTARTFDERVYVDSSGAGAVVWTITGLQDTSHTVLLPWCYRQAPAALAVSGPFEARLVVIEGASFLSLGAATPIDCDSVVITFTLPELYSFDVSKRADFGNFTIKKRFVNTTLLQIRRMSSEVFLPPGYDIATVDETLPEKPSGESASPFDIIREGDRNGIAIDMDNARLGDALYVKMKVKASAKSPAMLIMFVCIAVGYLVVFRDIVRTPRTTAPPTT